MSKKRLSLAFSIVMLVAFAFRWPSHGPAVTASEESSRDGLLMLAADIRNTREVTTRYKDAKGNEWTESTVEVLDSVPGGLPQIEQQIFQKASQEESVSETLPRRSDSSSSEIGPELSPTDPLHPLDEPSDDSFDHYLNWYSATERRTPGMSPGRFNIPSPTFGGRQYWSDHQFFRGWRIQEHFYTGHYRLLDSSNVRRAWGTLEDCQKALAQEKQAQKLAPMTGTAVIALHGILRSSHVWCDMEKAMEQDGVTFIRLEYPSTQKPISEFATQLQSVIHSLEGIEEIHLVAHSLGGLVVRKWCQDYSDSRVRRLVMIGTPNSGAEMADMLHKNWIYRGVYGPSGQQLGADPQGFIRELPRPTMEFAVIAGGKGTPDGFNPLIPGDDDGIVTLKSARLPGAVDSITIRGLHSFQPWNPEVIEATKRYLRTGALRESGVREPILLEPLP